MIGAFRNAKIGTKMTVLGTVASTTSLVLATAALMVFAYRNELDALHAGQGN